MLKTKKQKNKEPLQWLPTDYIPLPLCPKALYDLNPVYFSKLICFPVHPTEAFITLNYWLPKYLHLCCFHHTKCFPFLDIHR